MLQALAKGGPVFGVGEGRDCVEGSDEATGGGAKTGVPVTASSTSRRPP